MEQFAIQLLSSKVDQIKYLKGEYIVREGDMLDRVFWILRGTASVMRSI